MSRRRTRRPRLWLSPDKARWLEDMVTYNGARRRAGSWVGESPRSGDNRSPARSEECRHDLNVRARPDAGPTVRVRCGATHRPISLRDATCRHRPPTCSRLRRSHSAGPRFAGRPARCDAVERCARRRRPGPPARSAPRPGTRRTGTPPGSGHRSTPGQRTYRQRGESPTSGDDVSPARQKAWVRREGSHGRQGDVPQIQGRDRDISLRRLQRPGPPCLVLGPVRQSDVDRREIPHPGQVDF